MTDPTPQAAPPAAPPKAGWTPTTSTINGGILGGALAQIIVAIVEQFAHLTISSATTAAISTLCVVLCGYFFPDGGRK